MVFDPDAFLAENEGKSGGFDPDAFLEKHDKKSEAFEGGLFDQADDYAIEKIIEAGRFIDRYAGAPTRKAISEAQEGRSPIEGFAGQFGEDPETAPTGVQIAEQAGIPTTAISDVLPGQFTDDPKKAEEWLTFQKGGPADITARGAAGLGIEVLADPINLIPGAAIGKVGVAGGKALKIGGELMGAGVKAVAKPIAKGLAKTTETLGHAGTGIPKKNIRTYIEKFKEVEEVIAKHGDDVTESADELRRNLQASIRDRIGTLSDDIKETIKSAPKDSFQSNEATIDALEFIRDGINKEYYPGAIDEINDILSRVKKSSKFKDDSLNKVDEWLQGMGKKLEDVVPDAPPREVFDAKAANEAKKYLQEMSKGTYFKGGQMFSTSKQAGKASKQAARHARKAEIKLAPQTAKANKELAQLHELDKLINKNLITPGKPEGALLSAGSGLNKRNIRNLKKIEKLTGFDALGEAEKLAAARAFADPGLIPVDVTGKSAARMGGAALIGSLKGPLGVMAMMLFTSPKALKAGIKAGVVSKNAIVKMSGMTGAITDDLLNAAIKVSKTKVGQEAARSAVIMSKGTAIEADRLKGKDKWANDGLNKVINNSDINKEKLKELKENKKVRFQLIRISNMKPGSKGYKSIIQKLDKILKEGK